MQNTKYKILHTKYPYSILIAVIVVLLVLVSNPFKSWVSAQLAGQSLEVSPPSQEITGDPGSTIHVTSKVRNGSNSTLPVSVSINDFTASGDQGQVALTTGGPWSVVSWTTVSPQTFSLAPGEEQSVTATIKIPKNAAGGHYGSFVFAVKPANQSNGASVGQQIASLFLLKVSGPVTESLALTNISAPAFSESGPIPFSMNFTNNGNVYVKTYGLINVTDMFGNKVADIIIPGTNVFPQANRMIQASLDKHFLIGRYTATAIMDYGTIKNQSNYATTTFIVFPIRIAGGVILLLIILFLLRKRLGKALKALGGK